MITEYNEEFHLAHERKVWLEEGTLQERTDNIRKLVSKGFSFEEACRLLDLSQEQIAECISFTQSASEPDKNR